MTSALQELLERHVAVGTVPGVVASLGTAELKIVAAGAMSARGAPMRADAIMRVKSMTKGRHHGRGLAPGRGQRQRAR